MIYVATRRAHWSAAPSVFKFFGTTVMCGAAAVAWLTVLGPADGGTGRPSLRGLLVVVLITAVSKLGFEVTVLRHLRERQHTVWKRVALLMVRDLHDLTLARFLLGILGGVLLPAALLASLGPRATVAGGTIAAVTAMFLFLVAGELLERHLFFKAAPASRMPGGLV
jgi:DMSO reductase anchor subunit